MFNLQPPETILIRENERDVVGKKITFYMLMFFLVSLSGPMRKLSRHVLRDNDRQRVAGSFILRMRKHRLFTSMILRELISSFIPRGATKSHGSLQNCN